jgi:amino-acid N-acetyltransferase
LRRLRPACAIRLGKDELDGLVGTLAAAGLPFEDVFEQDRTFFRVEDDAGLIGFGGWEGVGSDRLLRSLVVAPPRRGKGLGRTAVALIEAEARSAGTERLHLLTTTAAPFFRALGYRDAERAGAPGTIRGSREFSSLCPASAAYLVKPLLD